MAPGGALKITRRRISTEPAPRTGALYKFLPASWSRQLSAKALGVTPGRAQAIQRMMAHLRRPTRQAADTLIVQTRSWRTRAGKPLKPTTRENMLSALCAGFRAITGRALETATVRAERRIIKKNLATHIRKQAVPATKREVERLLSDTAVPLRIRHAVRMMWCLGLRAGDLGHIRGKDVLNQARLRLQGAAVVRMRGVKGVGPGSRGYHRFLPLTGLAAPLARLLAETRPEQPVFTASTVEIVRALRLVNPKLSGHSPRRGSATHLANAGASMRQIRDHLGHQRLSSTRLYVAPAVGQRDALRRRAVATMLL